MLSDFRVWAAPRVVVVVVVLLALFVGVGKVSDVGS